MADHKNANQLYVELENEASHIETPLEKATRELNEMYDTFKREIDIDTVITSSEFEEFKPLFSLDTREQANGNELSISDVMELADLSQRFSDRVNTHHPIHVVDDYTKEEVFTLPPIFNKMRPIDNDKAEIIDAYRNYNDPKRLSQNNGPIMEAKKDAINQAMYRSIVESQPVEELQRNMTEFETLATAFHKKVLANNPFASAVPQVNMSKDEAIHKQATNDNNTETDNNYDDDFDF